MRLAHEAEDAHTVCPDVELEVDNAAPNELQLRKLLVTQILSRSKRNACNSLPGKSST